MSLAATLRLYAYHREAAARVLETAALVSGDEFVREVVRGQPSMRDTLVHLVATEARHLDWAAGRLTHAASFAREFPAPSFPDVDSVSAFWVEVSERTARLVGELDSDGELDRILQRDASRGGPSTRHLWEVLQHVANHATQHRTEVALMLTALGHSTGDLDLL